MIHLVVDILFDLSLSTSLPLFAFSRSLIGSEVVSSTPTLGDRDFLVSSLLLQWVAGQVQCCTTNHSRIRSTPNQLHLVQEQHSYGSDKSHSPSDIAYADLSSS